MGNGGVDFPSAHSTVTPPYRRRPLNPEWKAYRRGIEWRCRWLELRTKELLCQEKRYAQLLSKFRTDKEAALVAQMLRHGGGDTAGGPHTPSQANAHMYTCIYMQRDVGCCRPRHKDCSPATRGGRSDSASWHVPGASWRVESP